MLCSVCKRILSGRLERPASCSWPGPLCLPAFLEETTEALYPYARPPGSSQDVVVVVPPQHIPGEASATVFMSSFFCQKLCRGRVNPVKVRFRKMGRSQESPSWTRCLVSRNSLRNSIHMQVYVHTYIVHIYVCIYIFIYYTGYIWALYEMAISDIIRPYTTIFTLACAVL